MKEFKDTFVAIDGTKENVKKVRYLLKSFFKENGITILYSTSYHPKDESMHSSAIFRISNDF